jgi:methylmalonyl-CoA/ethylmalonyl-CoA epimerase
MGVRGLTAIQFPATHRCPPSRRFPCVSSRSPSTPTISNAPPRSTPTCSFNPPGLVFFQVGTTRLLLETGAPSALIYLEIPDVRAFAESWKARGNQVESEPHIIFHHETDALGPEGTDEWMTFIRDSEGNLLGLVSHLPTA